MLAHVILSLLVFKHGFIQMWFGIFECFYNMLYAIICYIIFNQYFVHGQLILPVQRDFFTNSVGDLLLALGFLGELDNFCNFEIIFFNVSHNDM